MKSVNTRAARVAAVHRERYILWDGDEELAARLKASVFLKPDQVRRMDKNSPGVVYPTVGDYVDYIPNPLGDSVVTAVRPRKSYFSRRNPSPGRGEQAVAANFDVVFAASSMNHDFNLRKLERYIAMSRKCGAETVVLLTKLDLCAEPQKYIADAETVSVGSRIITVSSATGENLGLVNEYLPAGKTAVFLGSSGVGKSSLINALAGTELMSVGEIREDDSRGRHTTSHRELLRLPSGAFVIDTPGMRELGMWDAEPAVAAAFPDVVSLFRKCRFSSCTHTTESGCAVLEALESGRLSRKRWENYLSLTRESRPRQ